MDDEESKMFGVVDPRVYWTYLSFTGNGFAIFFVVAVFVMYLLHSGQDIWMTVWVRHVALNNGSSGGNGSSSIDESGPAGGNLFSIDEGWYLRNTGNSSWIPLEKSTDELIFYLG